MVEMLAVGTIPTDQTETPVSYGSMPTDGSDTSLLASQLNIAASSAADAAHMNANHQILFDTAVRNYNLNMESGQKHNPPLTPPVAPPKWVLLPADAAGFQYYGPSAKEFLTPTPPLVIDTTDHGDLPSMTPATAPPNVFMGIGHAADKAGVWYDANFGDTIPSGQTAPPQPDGRTYTKVGSPVGWGWWQRS